MTRQQIIRSVALAAALVSLSASAQQGIPSAESNPQSSTAATRSAPSEAPPPPPVPEDAPTTTPPPGASGEGRTTVEQRPRLGPPPTQAAPPTFRPLFSLRAAFYSGFPDTFGLSASLTFAHPFELEAGVSVTLLLFSAYVRGGVSWPLIDARNAEGMGPTLSLPVLVGYRRLTVWNNSDRYDCLNGVVGLDATYWLAPHFGFQAQLVGGALLNLSPSTNDPSSGLSLLPDVRLTVGLAF